MDWLIVVVFDFILNWRFKYFVTRLEKGNGIVVLIIARNNR
jgi:hypothetical protein